MPEKKITKKAMKKQNPVMKYLLIGSLSLFLICLIIAIIGTAGIFYQLSKGLPDIRELKNYKPSLTTRVYSDANELIDEFYIEYRVLVPLSKIPKILIKATIAV